MTNEAIKQLRTLIFDAKVCEINGSAVINGHNFEVRTFMVNRKCYDFLPVQTIQIKMDGKRISYDKVVATLS